MTRRWQTWVLGALALAVVAAAVQAGTEYYVGNASDALVGNFRYIYPGTGTYAMQWQNSAGTQVAQIDQYMGLVSDTGIKTELFGGVALGIFASSGKFGINVDESEANSLGCGATTTGGYAYVVKPQSGPPTTWQTIIGSNLNGCTIASQSALLAVINNNSGNYSLLVRGATGQSANTFRVEDDGSNLLFSIEADGDLRTSRTTTTATLTGLVRKLQIFDAAGTSMGYIPIYSTPG